MMAATAPTALVCEDDPTTGRAVEAILRRCGFSVLARAASAAEGVAIAAAAPVDVVVVNVVVAGHRGLGVISSFLELRPGCAVVVLSPFESLSDAALAAGAFALLAGWSKDPRILERCLVDAAATVRRAPAVAAAPGDHLTPPPVPLR